MKPRYRTGDQIWMRERNLAIVLNYVWEAGQPISRAYLTQVSGLTKSTIGNLLAQLKAWGFIRETGMSEPRLGRPGVLIDINPGGGRLIGVEIGVGFVSVAVTDMKTQVLWCRKEETCGVSLAQTQVLEQAEGLIQQAIAQATACDRRLFGIGVGVPGLVDHATGSLLFAPNLQWNNVPLRDMWQKLSLAGSHILPRAQRELALRALAASRAGVKITLSAFKFDACVMGGVALILREILNNPAAWQPAPPVAPLLEQTARTESVL